MTNSIFKSLEAQYYQGTWRAKLHTSGRNSNQSLILQQNFFFQQYNFIYEFRDLYKAHQENQRNSVEAAPRSLSRWRKK